ncbi:hypothetical protein AHOG_15765 [Actinoalloteichus hoggarensis]|uniref:Uncharacterized protein n=2 Tax=Actinoalloteichus hoggarensis TaxID=1470176 RepID=A0A221W5E0_9PSEU|nr:hypothetical protein AHOG_15765 [Actinoalloteichus hoggarensis]
MHRRADETEREAMARRSRTCFYCPREDATVAESLEHEKTHETRRSRKTPRGDES